MTGKAPQFVSKFFAAVCIYLYVQNLATNAYHPQTNGQVDQLKETSVAQLFCYVAKHQKGSDPFVQWLT